MAFTFSAMEAVPKERRRKTAKERRDQKERSMARAFQAVAAALTNVASHRGGNLRRVGIKWHGHLLAPEAKNVPLPRFRTGDIHRRQFSESDDAADDSYWACLTTASNDQPSLERVPTDGSIRVTLEVSERLGLRLGMGLKVRSHSRMSKRPARSGDATSRTLYRRRFWRFNWRLIRKRNSIH